MRAKADAVVAGGGLAGVACAHYLARTHGARVLIVDPRPFLSYTSALSTECYRNYWATHRPMTAFMNRSIDLLEQRASECDNAFSMSRRGYCFLSATDDGARRHLEAARLAGPSARVFDHAAAAPTYEPHAAYDAPDGGLAVLSGGEAVRSFFSPLGAFLSREVKSAMFAPRCGWMNAQQMGSHLLAQAKAAGVETLAGARVVGVEAEQGALRQVIVAGREGEVRVACGSLVNCAGPHAAEVHRMMLRGVSEAAEREAALQLALRNEVHAKAVLRDRVGAVPQDAPMLIWDDDVSLGWSDEEREELRGLGGWEATLADVLPAGPHFRPYAGGERSLLLLWEALHKDVRVSEPPEDTPQLRGVLFAELMLRGLRRMVPRLGEYLNDDVSLRSMVSVDGGYYAQTPDNLPLIGPTVGGPTGTYVCAGLSGYGVMASNAAGELLASHVAGSALPSAYASDFLPERWLDADYCAYVQSGQAQKGLQI
ncbi:hypothetical protein AB1Y20_004953 [Prymnesium parvum]|uniref:FAD-dependent oxidoreductase domain-containing protein 1 n=1 Tax=Prymnesium parvum TaxID=97485 RepID=A0AB34J1Y1_PRYPA